MLDMLNPDLVNGGKLMSYGIGEYTYINSYHEGKKGYINKFDKSLKSPFLNVLNNHLPNFKPNHIDESDVDESEVVVSDNVELSSAIVSASDIGNQA